MTNINQSSLKEALELLEDKKTWQDYLSNIPFYFAYWFSYPFIWLAYWLWQGIMGAKEEVWD